MEVIFLNKYLKIFVVCFALIALLSFSCFATSAPTYGHYISPGNYSFNENVDFSALPFSPSFDFNFRFRLISDNTVYYGVRPFYGDLSTIYGIGYIRENNGVVVVYDTYSIKGWEDGSRQFEVLDGFYITEPSLYQWWVSNTVRINPGYNSTLFDNILSVFSGLGEWISSSVSAIIPMFWANDTLTFVGVLAVSSLCLAVSLLILYLVSSFVKFRG